MNFVIMLCVDCKVDYRSKSKLWTKFEHEIEVKH